MSTNLLKSKISSLSNHADICNVLEIFDIEEIKKFMFDEIDKNSNVVNFKRRLQLKLLSIEEILPEIIIKNILDLLSFVDYNIFLVNKKWNQFAESNILQKLKQKLFILEVKNVFSILHIYIYINLLVVLIIFYIEYEKKPIYI